MIGWLASSRLTRGSLAAYSLADLFSELLYAGRDGVAREEQRKPGVSSYIALWAHLKPLATSTLQQRTFNCLRQGRCVTVVSTMLRTWPLSTMRRGKGALIFTSPHAGPKSASFPDALEEAALSGERAGEVVIALTVAGWA